MKKTKMDDCKCANCKCEVVTGDKLVERVKEVIHEGNVRRIIIKSTEGKTYMEIPVNVGIIGFLITPPLIAVAAVAAMAGAFKVELIRRGDKAVPKQAPKPASKKPPVKRPVAKKKTSKKPAAKAKK